MTSKIWSLVRSDSETWFEIVVDVQVSALYGGLVSPGTLS